MYESLEWGKLMDWADPDNILYNELESEHFSSFLCVHFYFRLLVANGEDILSKAKKCEAVLISCHGDVTPLD